MVAPTSEAAFINWHIGATMASPSGTPKRPPLAFCFEHGTKSRCMSMIISASFLFMGAVAFVILSRVPAPVRDSHSENISDPPPLNLNEAAAEVKIGGGRNDSRGGCCVSPQVTFSEQENPMTQRAENPMTQRAHTMWSGGMGYLRRGAWIRGEMFVSERGEYASVML